FTFAGTTPQQVTTSTKILAFDWRARLALSRRILFRPGMRIGDFHMVFQDPHFKDPGATPDHGTEEFLIGPTASLDFPVAGRLGVGISGEWLYMPSATRMKMTVLSLAGSYWVT